MPNEATQQVDNQRGDKRKKREKLFLRDRTRFGALPGADNDLAESTAHILNISVDQRATRVVAERICTRCAEHAHVTCTK